MRRALAPIAALLALTCCVTATRGPADLAGSWGGPHARLTMGESSGTAEFDCAAAEVGAGLTPDAAGRFSASGVYHAGHGGPVRLGEPRPSIAARFSGTIVGKTMTLEIRLADGQQLGPFSLVRGEEAGLLRCL